MLQMLVHESDSQRRIFGSHGVHNFFMFGIGMLSGAGALVHQRNQCAARNQIPQHLRQHIIAHELGHTHMKITQQLGASRGIVLGDSKFFNGDMPF